MEPRKLLQRDGTKEGYGQRELKGSHQPNHSEVTDVVIWFPNQVFEKTGKPGRGSGPGTMIRRWAMDSRLPAPGSEGNIGPIAKASFSRLASAERYDPKGRTS